jgi:hypothetical protein
MEAKLEELGLDADNIELDATVLTNEMKKIRLLLVTCQNECDHEGASKEHHANQGNYDPSCDKYWTTFTCPKCFKVWSEDGSL